jgi:chromosome segregation ATPase
MTEQARNLDTRRSDIRSCRHKINQVKASIDRTSGIFSSISKFLSTVNTDKEDLTNGVQKFQVQVTEYEQMLSSYTEKVAQFDPEINDPEDFGEELDLMKLEVGFRRKQLKVDLKLFEMSIKFDRIER